MSDVAELVEMWTELRQQGGRRGARAISEQVRAEVARRYREIIDERSCRIVVALAEGSVVGMALLTVTSASALLDVPTVQVSHLYVGNGYRRRGIGKALVAAAAAYAEERGVDQVTVSVEPGARDANRFYARLGFAPSVVRRVAPVAVLRRQLAADDTLSLTLRRELRLRRGALTHAPRLADAAAPLPRSEV